MLGQIVAAEVTVECVEAERRAGRQVDHREGRREEKRTASHRGDAVEPSDPHQGVIVRKARLGDRHGKRRPGDRLQVVPCECVLSHRHHILHAGDVLQVGRPIVAIHEGVTRYLGDVLRHVEGAIVTNVLHGASIETLAALLKIGGGGDVLL